MTDVTSAPLFIAWVALFLGVSWRGRPARPVELTVDVDAPHGSAPLRAVSLFDRAGQRIQSAVPALADLPSSPIGVAVILGSLLLPWQPVLATAAGMSILLYTWFSARSARRAAQWAAESELVFFIEMLAQALRAGLTARQSVVVIGPYCGDAVGAAISRLSVRLSRGDSLVRSLGELERTIPASDRLVAAVRSCETSGAPLVGAVTRIAEAMRLDRGLVLTERARQLPVRMLLPLTVFFLPAFVLVAVIPVLLSGFDAFSFP